MKSRIEQIEAELKTCEDDLLMAQYFVHQLREKFNEGNKNSAVAGLAILSLISYVDTFKEGLLGCYISIKNTLEK
ncbi:MAG: hypothetical protein HUJ63_02940 [Enterococcus sp.]|nr:hypothetical protein [Enterococcus sp.]